MRYGGAAAGAARGLLTPQQQSSLAERVRSREPSAEEELVSLFRPQGLVLARTHDPETARDLAQEVMLAVVRAVRQEQLREPERLAGFVYGTARNVINNYLRNRSRLPREDSIEAALHLASPPDAAEDTERMALVRRALGDPGFDRPQDSVADARGRPEARRDWHPARPDSEIVRARKSRALKKTIDRVKRLSRT